MFRCRAARLDLVAGSPDGAKRATLTGPILIVLDDGTELLRKVGSGFSGVPADKLAAKLIAQLRHGTRLVLEDEPIQVWMTFRLRDESRETSRWARAKSTRKEILARRQELATAATRLPARLQPEVGSYLDLLAVVSAIEGGFGSTSGPGDTHASLGIFQWAMQRDQAMATGSLGRFFRDLKARAQAAAADRFFVEAWAECTAQGLDTRQAQGRTILTIAGADATGDRVERALAGAMARGNLAAYQLIASLDWIADFKTAAITPGANGRLLLGHEWEQIGTNPPRARLASAKGKLDIAAANFTRVSQVFTSQAALATAIMLGVNRPSYVALALWRALGPNADPLARTGELLDAVLAACIAAGQKPAQGRFTAQHVKAAGTKAIAAWQALQAYLWPLATLPPGGEPAVRAAFESKALFLYKPQDARKYKREGRFATVRALLP